MADHEAQKAGIIRADNTCNESITVMVAAEDQPEQRVTVKAGEVVCSMRHVYGEQFDGLLFGEEQIDEGDTFEDTGINDGAWLRVMLTPETGFPRAIGCASSTCPWKCSISIWRARRDGCSSCPVTASW